MSQQTGPPTTEVARDQAGQVGRSAADAGQQVAGTVGEQAGEVVKETRRQATDLLQQAREQAAEQARGGQQQAAQGLRSLADELRQMADGGDQHGPVSDLAAQAADRVGNVAGWLDRHEPGDLFDEVRRLARRRPGAFLLGAAVAGIVAGRLTRGAVDAQRDTGAPKIDPAATTDRFPAVPPVVTPPVVTPPITTPPVAPPTPLPTYDAPASVPVQVPNDPYPGTPAHAPRPGATTVGDYVDELGRRGRPGGTL